MLAGIQLDLFSNLVIGPKGVPALAQLLSLDEGKLEILMYVLADAGIVTVHDGIFANTAEAYTFLVKGKTDYLGEEFEAFSDRWARLAMTSESIKTGNAQAKVDYSNMSTEELETFYMGNHSRNREAGLSLMNQFDFSGVHRLLDVAGGTGGLAIAITQSFPRMMATVVEQPNVVPVTKRFIDEAAANGSVEVVTGDITQVCPAGIYDAAVMKNFIPVVSKADAGKALKNIAQSMRPGGILYMVDNGILDNSRLTPKGVVVNSLFFLNVFDDGGPRTEAERSEWLAKAGFVNIQRSTLDMGLGVIVAHKPA